MGTPRVPILGASNWAQSNNNLNRNSVPLETWGEKAEREKSRFGDAL